MSDLNARMFRKLGALFTEWASELELELSSDEAVAPEPTSTPQQDHNLGKRQLQIVEVPGIEAEEGLRTSEIARQIDYEVPNTYTTLQALVRQGVVEQVPGKEPQHWRLARRYRPRSDAFAKIAGHVRRGEWTTYGDISIAVHGTLKAARGVGRAAATVPDFPTPHRVLLEGGRIADTWKDGQGGGPEVCQRRLEEEGVQFTEGHADPARRVGWDILMQRDAAASL